MIAPVLQLLPHCRTLANLARAALVVCALTMVAGCGEKNKYVEPPPPEVIVANPQQRDVIEFLEATGTARPLETVEIRARVRGFLKERKVKEGTVVHAGDLLLVIDEEPFKVALEEVKANEAAAATALLQAKQSQSRAMMRAQLALDQSQFELAVSQEQRARSLATGPSRAVSQEEWDQAVAKRKEMEAKVAVTTANLAQVEADYETNIASADAKLAAAKTAVRSAEINLGYCRVTSPIDGRIGRVNYDVGNLVGDGQASLLTTIVKFDPIRVYASLSVDDFTKYRNVAGEPVANARPDELWPIELNLAEEKGYKHRGGIDYHDQTVDRDTGTIQIRGEFPNSDGVILPGMIAYVRIPIGKRTNALLVPEPAIATDQLGQYVYVVDADNKVVYRQVHTGQAIDGMRVVEGKIERQDRVIIQGLLRARPGLVVVPKVEVAQTAETPATVAADSK